MANVDQAIDFVLSQEDSKMSGHVTTLKGDSGGATRFGIAQRSHPELTDYGFFDENRMQRGVALVTAEHVYTHDYANPLLLWQIQDQKLANAVLSFAVNAGVRIASRRLQNSCYYLGLHIEIDGKIGQATIAAINHLKPESLLAEFSLQAKVHYGLILQGDATQQRFFQGWLNRVDAWTA